MVGTMSFGGLNGFHPTENGSGDASGAHNAKQLAPPFTDLSLIPNCLYRMQKQQVEEEIRRKVKQRGVILIDAGAPKVQSRLYGGVFPDWTTGGMWANSSNFISSIRSFCEARENQYQLVVAFDGSIDVNNLSSWLARMEQDYENIRDVFGRIEQTGRPPVGGGSFQLWFPPTALQTTLRLICLSQEIQVVCTLYEHEPELVVSQPVTSANQQRGSWLERSSVFFTNSLEYYCYSDIDFVSKALWGESLKLNMRGDKMTGKKIDNAALARFLGIKEESLDAGLLYYGTRYFLDCNKFDPVPDLHHELQSKLSQGDYHPARRVQKAIDLMKDVHKKAVNLEDTEKIGASLVPSVDHVMKCLKNRTDLPPHFEHLGRGDEVPRAQVEALAKQLKDRARDAFLEVGQRLLNGVSATAPEPYYLNGARRGFAHQSRYMLKFLEQIEQAHRQGQQHEWIAHLLLGEEPTIRIPYTMGDRGKLVIKLRDDPKIFFRDLRRRAYGMVLGITPDYDASRIPAVREIFYGGVDLVYPIPLVPQISNLATSMADLWKTSNPRTLSILLRLVLGDRVPAHWEAGFGSIPEWTWVGVIALRCILDREPRLMGDGYLDALLATISALATLRTATSKARQIDNGDRNEKDAYNQYTGVVYKWEGTPDRAMLMVTPRSVTFASFFMTAVDHVVFVNDVVGGLISPSSMNPCNFYDGNVFHTKLAQRNAMMQHGRGRLEDLLETREKIALFLKLRSVALAGLTERDLPISLLDAETHTVEDLMRRGLLVLGDTPASAPVPMAPPMYGARY